MHKLSHTRYSNLKLAWENLSQTLILASSLKYYKLVETSKVLSCRMISRLLEENTSSDTLWIEACISYALHHSQASIIFILAPPENWVLCWRFEYLITTAYINSILSSYLKCAMYRYYYCESRCYLISNCWLHYKTRNSSFVGDYRSYKVVYQLFR